MACETLVTTGLAIVAGEITTKSYVDFQTIVRETIREVGYTRAKYGFDYETCAVLSSIHGQSPDIAQGVDPGGAGDQGLMFGYACTETDELMPLPIMLAHKLVKGLSCARRDGVLDYLRPDGKSQVSVEYDNGRPVRVDTVVVSTQHSSDVSNETLREDITQKIVNRVIPDGMMDDKTRILINPTGRFVVGGPHGDAGVTGRKIIVDTYGGAAPHGGGAFSGKDPTKVDRSACYMARYVAKNVVAAGLAEKLPGAARLRHRRGRAGFGPDRHLGHRHRAGRADQRPRARALQADAARHHRDARPAPADLQEDRGVRPLRPHRAGVHLGADRQG